MSGTDEQYFNFRKQHSCHLYVDGNYMLNISRALNIKLDMEKLFDELTKDMFRYRSYWFAALESSLDRNNNAYRFLDRLKYIPRTEVYSGRMTKRPHGHYETALRTDAGISLAVKMVENSVKMKDTNYHILIAGDPEYVPAIRSIQQKGGIVRIVYPENFGDLDPHPDLLKAADERVGLDSEFFRQFEYISEYEDYEEEYDDDYEEEDYDDLDMIDDTEELDDEMITEEPEGLDDEMITEEPEGLDDEMITEEPEGLDDEIITEEEF